MEDARQFGMFNNVNSVQGQPQGQLIEATKQHHYEMTEQMKEIMKASLNKKRWAPMDLGAAASYTHDNMIDRWNIEKNKWLHRSVEKGE